MNKLVTMKMSDIDFEKLVNDISSNRSNIRITNHAKDRMIERNILRKHVDICLQKGRVIEPAHIGSNGNWIAKMTRNIAGMNIDVV